MKAICRILLLAVFVSVAIAQSPEPPLSDTRLTVHTLLREDIFAGFLVNDMERFTRGEKNIDLLLEKRPGSKAELLAWKGSAKLYRSVLALENKQQEDFQKEFKLARDLFSEAHKIGANNGGVAAITGGSYALFADRLPEKDRPAAWEQAYESYQVLWQQQAPAVDRLPVHIRGELLAGLAQSAQRTGRKEELTKYLDKIIEVLSDTPYEPIAKQWKSKPGSAASSSITCLTCHDAGRLSSRLTALNSK